MIEPTMSDTHAQYEPVGSGENSETAIRCRKLPARLLAPISELDGKPEVSVAHDVPALHL
jgi:hypothetical protein